MHEQHPYRAIISPVPYREDITRPLWSVMIPTYNCAGYLRETLASVLAQDPGPELMQIAVVDNCSTQDDPASVVADMGGGRVEFYSQPENVGHVRNFSSCLQHSRGQLVHILHGDDCVREGFYEKMQRLFEEHPQMGAAFCRHMDIDGAGYWLWIAPLLQLESGVLENWLERIATDQPITASGMVVRREVYEKLGGFDQRQVNCSEDWEMWTRISVRYPIGYEVEPLALYRKHPSAMTGRSIRSGQNIRDAHRAVKTYLAYMPPNVRAELAERAKWLPMRWALDLTYQSLNGGSIPIALAQTREALKCNHSPRVVATFAKMYVGAAIRRTWRLAAINYRWLRARATLHSE